MAARRNFRIAIAARRASLGSERSWQIARRQRSRLDLSAGEFVGEEGVELGLGGVVVHRRRSPKRGCGWEDDIVGAARLQG